MFLFGKRQVGTVCLCISLSSVCVCVCDKGCADVSQARLLPLVWYMD